MPCSFRDESLNSQVMAAGSAGSWEFGLSTPTTTGGVVTIDGVNLNTTAGFFLGNGLAASSSLQRVTGSILVAANSSSSINTTAKSDYTVIGWEKLNVSIFVGSLSTTSISLDNTTGVSVTANYSWI